MRAYVCDKRARARERRKHDNLEPHLGRPRATKNGVVARQLVKLPVEANLLVDRSLLRLAGDNLTRATSRALVDTAVRVIKTAVIRASGHCSLESTLISPALKVVPVYRG